jgi:hypothetical protein
MLDAAGAADFPDGLSFPRINELLGVRPPAMLWLRLSREFRYGRILMIYQNEWCFPCSARRFLPAGAGSWASP